MDELNEIFENLYNGNININVKVPNSNEYIETLEECNIILKNIENKLDDAGKKLLNEYIEMKSQVTSIECKEKFIEGYKLASKLIIAGIK